LSGIWDVRRRRRKRARQVEERREMATITAVAI
jgi:hypothetical protein